MVERMLVLAAVAGGVALLIGAGRAFVAARRRRALAAAPFTPARGAGEAGPVRVLAFSTPQCQQCRLLQKPALAEVAAQTEQVEILSIDALEQPELAERYGILTVPSTVVLAPNGRASAVNYGFAPARVLLEQIAGASIALAR
jgi:thioredoxin 1